MIPQRTEIRTAAAVLPDLIRDPQTEKDGECRHAEFRHG
jgi:hypothetical protein